MNNRDAPEICLQHLTAVMLVDGDVSFRSSHDRARMKDKRILALRHRVELSASAELSNAGGRQAIVEVQTRDGRLLRHHTERVRGTAANPMSRAEVASKYAALVNPILGERRAGILIETLWCISAVPDVCELRALLRGQRQR